MIAPASNGTAVARILFALDEPTRRGAFEHIAASPRAVGELASLLCVSIAAVSRHLKILREAGLVVEQRLGRRRIHRAKAEALDELVRYAQHLHREPERQDVAFDGDLLGRLAQAAASDASDVDPDFFLITFRMQRIVKYTDEAIGMAASSVGLLRGQLFVLEALKRLGPPYTSTPTQLQEIAWITLPGIGKQLDQLEASGLVKRMPNPSDKRGFLVRLTPKGLSTLTQATRTGMSSPHTKALREMSTQERQDLVRALGRFQSLIEKWRDAG